MLNKRISLLVQTFCFLLVVLPIAVLANANEAGPLFQRQAKQIQELNQRVLELEANLTNLQLQMQQLHLHQSHADTELTARGELEGEDPSQFQLVAQAPAGLAIASSLPDDKTAYDLALAALRAGDFTDAERKFSNFIDNYPESTLQSNAHFWYAESFYRRGIYNKAAISYLQCYKKYPKDAKASDALLKLAYTLASLNKPQQACNMLDKLDMEFPKRSITSTKRSAEAREKFKCK